MEGQTLGGGEGGKRERRTKERDDRERFAYVILQELTWCKQQVQNETSALSYENDIHFKQNFITVHLQVKHLYCLWNIVLIHNRSMYSCY